MQLSLRTLLCCLVTGVMLLGCFHVGLSAQEKPKQASNPAVGSTVDLQLVLDGPFVLCETATNILVLVPNVIDTPPPQEHVTVDVRHYPPVFKATLNEWPEGMETMEHEDVVLLLDASSSGKTVRPRSAVTQLVSDRVALVDNVTPAKPCTETSAAKTGPSAPYATVTIPKPDSISGIHPESFWISYKAIGKAATTSQPPPQQFATAISLLYKAVALDQIKIFDGKAAPNPLRFRVVDGQALLFLTLRPRNEDMNDPTFQHISYVNKKMSQLMGVDRNLSPVVLETGNPHGSCKAPTTIVCRPQTTVCGQPEADK
jgi:hypothetical protein